MRPCFGPTVVAFRAYLVSLCALGFAACARTEPPLIGPLDVDPSRALVPYERHEYRVEKDGQPYGEGHLTTSAVLVGKGGWGLDHGIGATTSSGERTAVAEGSGAYVDAQLRPINSERWLDRGDRPGDRYGVEYVDGVARERWFQSEGQLQRGEVQTGEFRLGEHTFDDASSFWLWRSLPLRHGYAARYVAFDQREQREETVELRVTERTTVDVPAGRFHVWRLEVRSGDVTQFAWIEVARPHRIVQWDDGAMLMQLVASGFNEEHPIH